MTDTASRVPSPDALLAHLTRRVASSLDLRETLQAVVQAVVDQLGFGCAVVNLAGPGDVCEVAAVAGPPEACAALLGTRAPMETIRRILDSCEPWGELRFLDHRKDQGLTRSVPSWVPPIPAVEDTGAWHPDDVLLAPLHAPDGTLIGVLSVDMPLDGRRPDLPRRHLLEQFAAHAALAIEHSRVHTLMCASEQLFRAMFDRSPIAIALLTEDGCIARVNEACARLLGQDAAALVGRPASQLTSAVPARRGSDAHQHDQYEVRFTRPDGSEVYGRVNRTPLAAGPGPRLVLTQIEDITLLRTVQARFAHEATHDQLTGLANRALVVSRLTAALADADAGGGQAAVLYCDVDHLKEINDTLGHAAGDQLLVEVGRSLASSARDGDTVGRFGGDEFVLVAYSVPGRGAAGRLAGRVIRSVRRPVELGGEPVLPSLSVGVALSARHRSADSVLAAADQALYAAKAAGRGQWRLAPDAP